MKYDASWCRFYPNRFYKIIIFLCIVYSFLHVIVIWILVRRAVTGKSILLHKHLIFLHLPLKLNTMLQSQLIFSSLYASYTNIKFIFWSDKNPQNFTAARHWIWFLSLKVSDNDRSWNGMPALSEWERVQLKKIFYGWFDMILGNGW